MTFVIYWELNQFELGFVSYDNDMMMNEAVWEYKPVQYSDASKYGTRLLAERTKNWYEKRGGFGFFKIMEVKD